MMNIFNRHPGVTNLYLLVLIGGIALVNNIFERNLPVVWHTMHAYHSSLVVLIKI